MEPVAPVRMTAPAASSACSVSLRRRWPARSIRASRARLALSPSTTAPAASVGPSMPSVPALKMVVGDGAAEALLTGQRVAPKKLADAGFAWSYPDLVPALENLIGPK